MSKKNNIGFLLIFLSTQLTVFQNTALAQTKTKTQIAQTSVAQTATKTICPAQLNSTINNVINRPLFNRVRWGILIQPLGSKQTLYSRDAQNYFIPASNTKLLTTAAAIQQLGGNFTIRTSIYTEKDGSLRVVGRGDPSLNDAQLQNLARQLAQRGIKNINKLVADDGYIVGDIVQPSWQWEDVQSDYGAPVGSFMVNENLFSFNLTPQSPGQQLKLYWNDLNEERIWRVVNQSTTVADNQPTELTISRDLSGNVLKIQGQLAANANPFKVTLPVVDPNYFFLRRLRMALLREKINLGQTTVETGGGSYQQEIASVQSPQLSELIAATNIDSNNLYAESLLRALAYQQTKKPNQGTADVGLEVLKANLTKLGVNPTSYVLVDGSGLSRKNLISPEALVQLLQGMATTSNAAVFRASLPVAGKTGTLKNRFRNTPAEGIVFAKTGTVGGVVSLSGYLNTPNYQPLVFSIIVNQSEQPAKVLRQAVDEIVVGLTQLKRC
jgi:serine-type D-Ala-D-Ala carboxypeptidase/endopeptidase (penicillin-binding protein 4)